MSRRRQFPLILFLLVFCGGAESQTFERVLLPLYVPHPLIGAYGSRWVTEFAAWNVGQRPATIFQSACVHDCSCVVGPGCVPGRDTPPGEKFVGPIEPNDSFGIIPAVFLYVPHDTSTDVSMQLRARELSREDHAGVEIPVVRDDDLFEGMLWLVDVPSRPDFRHHLRVYFVSSPHGSGQVRLRVFRDDTPEMIGEHVLTALPPLFEGQVPPAEDLNASAPGYASWAVPESMKTGASRLRLSIEPLTAGLRFWAMVSITHDSSQHVTLVTPQ